MVYPWGDSRRFNAYPNYFKKVFGQRVQKVSINAGFTCPNRDGSISTGGCTFCDNKAFSPSYCSPELSVRQQVDKGVAFHEKRYKKAAGFLAYFQAFSNTYAPVELLEKLYREALDHPRVIGIVIGTRPDCMDEEKLNLLSGLAREKYVVVEYGVESCYNDTLKRVNRGHTFEESEKIIIITAERGIHVGGHFILGLPGESRKQMLDAASIISRLPLKTVKFHQLQIVKDTPMANEYIKYPENFQLFQLDEYIDFFIDFLERLSPRLVIERFAGEVPPAYLVSKTWNARNHALISMLEKRLSDRDTWQGKYYY